MKNLTIIFANPNKPNSRETYILPDGMNGEDWKALKIDNWYIINEKINNAFSAGKSSVIIDIDKLPILNDNFSDLKSYMEDMLIISHHTGYIFTVSEWNVARQGAKSKFTAPCINRLDTSGFITQLLAKAKKQKHGK
jgi:hypothetical protein